jgi:hypothetical protein
MWLNSTTRMPLSGRPPTFRSFPRTRECRPLAEELGPRFRGDERVGAVFFLRGTLFFALFFFVVFAMQIALSACGFGV